MKKASKILISIILLVSMFAGYVPAFVQTQTASAAGGEPTYRYRKVNTLTPGKSYIIVGAANLGTSVNRGLQWALAPLGLSENEQSPENAKVGTAVIYTDGNYINASDGFNNTHYSKATSLADLEWQYLPGNAQSPAGLPATYMFQNTSTGLWLFNPVYENGNDGHQMRVTLDPLTDTYSPYTRQVFNSAEAVAAYNTANSLQTVEHYGTWGEWAKIQRTAEGDNWSQFSFGNVKGYTDFVITWHNFNTAKDVSLYYGIHNWGLSETRKDSLYHGGNMQQQGWRSYTANDFGINAADISASANIYRFDIECDKTDLSKNQNNNIILSSVFLAKNLYARVALQVYRHALANWGCNGYYPSQRYPFCQYAPAHVGNYAFSIGNFETINTYGNVNTTYTQNQQYFYGWKSTDDAGTNCPTFSRAWNENPANTFFFEKEEVTSADSVWSLVENSSEIVNGGEYLLVNANSTTSNARIISGKQGGGVEYENAKTVEGTSYTSTVYDYNIWKFVKVGNYYYLMDSLGEYLYTDHVGGYTMSTMAQADVGGNNKSGDHKIFYGIRYRWQYNFDTNKLTASHTNQNAGEAIKTTTFGLPSSGVINNETNSHIYLYKRTYCEHTTTRTETTAATCTAAGVTKTICTICGAVVSSEEIPALGHDYKDNGTVVTRPTCTEKGYTTYSCNRCDETHVGDYVNANGHTWGEWSVTKEATCDVAGERQRQCSVCKITETETITPLGHDYQPTVTAATCTTPGITTYECSRCHHTYTSDEVAPLGHNWGDWVVITPATRDQEGLERRTCSRCNATEERAIPMIKDVEVTVGSVETETNSSVRVPVTLSGNPGLYSQHFVIYFPLGLNLVSVEDASDVYPEGSSKSYTAANPVTNERMADYFREAGIDYTGFQGITYLVENKNLENTTSNGNILYLNFEIPENSPKEYTIGVFGVYADIEGGGHDAINVDADSVKIIYHDGKITVTNAIDCQHANAAWVTRTAATCTEDGYKEEVCPTCGKVLQGQVISAAGHNYESVVTKPTCTEAGYTTHTCTVCGDTYVDSNVPTSGHAYDNGVVVKHETGLSGIITRFTCTVCGEWYDVESGSGTGAGYSTGESAEYVYRLTDTVLPGREYIIANKNTAGSAAALTDSSTGISSGTVNVESDASGMYIQTSSNNALWTTANGILFNNKATGKYLGAYGTSDSSNITSASSPVGASGYTFNGNMSDASYYLGYNDGTSDGVTANPSGKYIIPATFTNLKGSVTNNQTQLWTHDNYTLDFDMSFLNATSKIRICRGTTDNYVEFSPTEILLYKDGETTTVAYEYGSSNYNFSHWNHFTIAVKNSVATISVNGVTVLTKNSYTSDLIEHLLFIYPSVSFGDEAAESCKVGLDNLVVKNVTSSGSEDVFSYDFDNPSKLGYIDEGTSTFSDVPSDITIGSVNGVLTGKFVATADSDNKVYFYEKTRLNDVSEIYTLVNTDLSLGTGYVLVASNSAGEAALVGGTGVTVYKDGISYTPYVNVSENNEFTIIKAENGVMLCGASGYLNSDGTYSQAPSSGSIIALNGNKITVNGTEYYLYKKTVVTAIDTDLVNDVAVVDFGKGFSLNADSTFRANDHWADSVSMTLSSIAPSLTNGTVTNTRFYPTSHTVGAANSFELSGGTASLSSSNISFAPKTAYDGEQSFNYEYTIDNLGAYIYGQIVIIPATTIYYEEDSGFITYSENDWLAVGTKEQQDLDLVLDDVYGNNPAYGNYVQFSEGTARKTVVRPEDVQNVYPMDWAPSATFTFRGTGFEVFSATGKTTGLIFVEVMKDGKQVHGAVIDNYFGYTYDAADETNHWKPVSTEGTVDTTPALWQVPVIKWNSNEWGEYTVKITCSYDKHFDHVNVGYSEFYLDGVRIFNPLGNNASDAAKAKYMEDGEWAPVFVNFRDIIANNWQAGDNRALFVDGNELTDAQSAWKNYKEVGAKNEVSIPMQKGIAFNLKADGQLPAKAAIGAKLIKGNSANVTVACGSKSMTITLNTATDMYYDIMSVINWNKTDAGWESDTIVITNTSDATVSLTTVKFSYSSDFAANVMLFADEATETDAWTTLTALYGVASAVLPGDVNGDERVNMKDFAAIRNYVSGESTEEINFANSDINGDGRITTRDTLALKQILSGLN